MTRNGYADASLYPLWLLQQMSDRLYRQVNQSIKTDAICTMLAVGATKSKKGSALFKNEMEKLQ